MLHAEHDVTRRDRVPLHLEGRVARQVEYLARHVLEHRGQVHAGRVAHPVAGQGRFEASRDARHRKQEAGARRLALALCLCCAWCRWCWCFGYLRGRCCCCCCCGFLATLLHHLGQAFALLATHLLHLAFALRARFRLLVAGQWRAGEPCLHRRRTSFALVVVVVIVIVVVVLFFVVIFFMLILFVIFVVVVVVVLFVANRLLLIGCCCCCCCGCWRPAILLVAAVLGRRVGDERRALW